MLTFFRNFFKSKIGLTFALAFLGLIAFAFASADVSSTGVFGGVTGGDRVAVVGDERIGTADLSQAATNAVDRARQENPTITVPVFLAEGGMEQVVSALIDRAAIAGYADEYGLRAGDNLINSEILQAFRGADGNFSQADYQAFLSRSGITDQQVREDLGTGLIARQLLDAATFGATVPDSFATRYAALFKERRQGSIGLLPSALYAPEGDPSGRALQAYYNENGDQFIRPERRTIRYATFDAESLGARGVPTDEEIAARYRRDRAQYAAREERAFTQVIVPTQAAAQSLRQRVAAGASLESVASEAGLRPNAIEASSKSEIATQTSAAVANAYFAAARGSVTEPARSALGWYVARVESVDTIPARSLADARGEITEALREEKRVRGLSDMAAELDEELSGGSTLAEVARDLGLELQTAGPITAEGQVYGAQDRAAPEILQPAISTAFQMQEGEPEIAAVQGGETYLVFEVTQITPSARAPLAEIREQVVDAWRLAQGSKAARAAADRILGKLRQGTSLAAALRAETPNLPAVETIDLTRQQLAQQRNQQVPAPLVLMFAMAEGTSKKLAAPDRAGWFVVDLDDISTDAMADDDPLIAEAQRQLGPVVAQEYNAQLRAAMRAELGVERNDDAIEAVRKQLLGEN